MAETHQGSTEPIRNMRQATTTFDILHERGPFRVIRFARSVAGSEVWVVNELDFLWEPAFDEAEAMAYLDSEEAREYAAERA